MKIKKTIFFAFCFTLMSTSVLLANPDLPEPPAQAARGTAQTASAPPPPPPGAIDQNLFLLGTCALLFGLYAIRKYDFIKKDSI
ncbi:hypothetical protein [Flavobacterium daemonense]|uniref:hypothetical protein n=1 Tax=Flavobacterium daemonense TaxID=1393049 RepID=UPI001185AAE4|nr:hypothetical protein [Flavobacterium daemonense]KAF2335651.1 hypothetical protein FND99_05685 [Flavobacterium daemonense]